MQTLDLNDIEAVLIQQYFKSLFHPAGCVVEHRERRAAYCSLYHVRELIGRIAMDRDRLLDEPLRASRIIGVYSGEELSRRYAIHTDAVIVVRKTKVGQPCGARQFPRQIVISKLCAGISGPA